MVLHKLLSDATNTHGLSDIQPGGTPVKIGCRAFSKLPGTRVARSAFPLISLDSKDLSSAVEPKGEKLPDAAKPPAEEPEKIEGQHQDQKLMELHRLQEKVFAPTDLSAPEAKEIQGEQAKEDLQDKPSIQGGGALQDNSLPLQDEKFKDMRDLARDTIHACWSASLRNRQARHEGQMTDATMHEFIQQMGGCVSKGSALISRLFEPDGNGMRASFKYQHGYGDGDLHKAFEEAWKKASESCTDLNTEARFDVNMQQLDPKIAATLFLKAGTCIHDTGNAIFSTPVAGGSATAHISACPPVTVIALLARLAPFQEASPSYSASTRRRAANVAASEFLFAPAVHCSGCKRELGNL